MDCVHPRNVRVPGSQQYITVPCGMCIGCRIAKTREWSLRLTMEKESWDQSCFLTLTYDEEHLPRTNCCRPTLKPDDPQKFWKRVRMELHRDKMRSDDDYRYHVYWHNLMPDVVPSPPLLRYFMCGEYGDETKRPHYHAIVFGTEFGNWWIHHYKSDGSPVYTSDELIKLWPFGLATVDLITIERIKYVCGYVQKKIYRDPWKYFQEYGCCVHPFQRVSQGIGKGFMDNPEFWYLDPKLKGVHYSVPRYFLKKNVMAEFIIHERIERLKSKGALANIESYESMQQREFDMKARSRMKKGKM